jgi:thiol-disulfide isomerase/thioredoxin
LSHAGRVRSGRWVALFVAGSAVAGSVAYHGLGGSSTRRSGTAGDSGVIAAPFVDRSQRRVLPDVAGGLLGGGRLSVRTLQGRIVVLNAWQSWCEPCLREIPILQGIHAHTHVAVVGVDVTDDASNANEVLRRSHATYPSISDSDGRILHSLAAFVPPAAVPSTIVVDRVGNVAAALVGRFEPGVLSAIIRRLEAESPPTRQGKPAAGQVGNVRAISWFHRR